MNIADGFAQRVLRLVTAAGSRRKLATLIGIKDGTIMAWEAGSVPYERTMWQIAEKTGVSIEWLRDGRGSEREQLERFRQHVRELAVKEDPAPYHVTRRPAAQAQSQAQGNYEQDRHLELAADEMDAAGIASFIARILRDGSSAERYRSAERLVPKLAQRLADEAAPHILEKRHH